MSRKRRKRRKRRGQRLQRRQRAEPKLIWAPHGELQEVQGEVDRLAYSRKQAAEALGVSISTIDRHVVKVVNTVKTLWGQRLIPLAELERFLHEHLEPPRETGEPGSVGRPRTLPRRIVERIHLEYARGHSLAEIARGLNDNGVPTAHGGRQWWPSTVRAVIARSNPPSPLSSAQQLPDPHPWTRLPAAAVAAGSDRAIAPRWERHAAVPDFDSSWALSRLGGGGFGVTKRFDGF